MKPILRSGQTLIGLLIVVAILIVMSVYFLGDRTNSAGEKIPGVAKSSIDRSQEVVLNSNLQQINQLIFMYKNDNNGQPPASLQELDIPDSMLINPVDKKPLQYDPKTGRVWAQPYAGQTSLGRAKPKVPDMKNLIP